jgi:hypothetical protein
MPDTIDTKVGLTRHSSRTTRATHSLSVSRHEAREAQGFAAERVSPQAIHTQADGALCLCRDAARSSGLSSASDTID